MNQTESELGGIISCFLCYCVVFYHFFSLWLVDVPRVCLVCLSD